MRFSLFRGSASQDVGDLVNVGFADRLVQDNLTASHRHDAIAGLEDVMQVVTDQYAGR
jgi:hypothetical protein